MALTGVALLSVLDESEFVVVEPVAALAMVLLALALPALYASERRWFGRSATIAFGLMSLGWVVATVGSVVTSLTMPPISETAFAAFLLGLLVAMVGAFAFGVAILRNDDATLPRLGAWLLVAALPVGLPFTLAFTRFVMGQLADPWAGPMLCYGLAWVAFGRLLWGRRAATAEPETTPQ